MGGGPRTEVTVHDLLNAQLAAEASRWSPGYHVDATP
jgi:hypothetical protein